MILEIECAWGREPGWFSGLEPDEQVRLLGWSLARQGDGGG